MSGKPIEFETRHYPSWSHVDPYFHVNSEFYLHYFIDHRFLGLRKELNLDLQEFRKLPFGIFLRNVNISYLHPVSAGQDFLIRSHVREWTDVRCEVTAEMFDPDGKKLSECQMSYVCVDLKTGRPSQWPPEFVARFYR